MTIKSDNTGNRMTNGNQAPSPRPFGKKENLALEFKRAARDLPQSLFETVCAFLNLDGGLIVLGVADDGTITGIAPDAVDRMKAEIASLSNNPNKLDPPYLLFPRAEEISGKWVIKIQPRQFPGAPDEGRCVPAQ